jgi:hypothetical protein
VADLVSHGLRVAEAARTEAHLRLCAKVVAESLNEAATEAQIDRAYMLLDILGQLQPAHVRVLET